MNRPDDVMDRKIIDNRDGFCDETEAENKLHEAINEGDEDAINYANTK